MARAGVQLPSDWRARSLRIDLGSAIEFLSSPQDRPSMHARARRQVERTLELLAS